MEKPANHYEFAIIRTRSNLTLCYKHAEGYWVDVSNFMHLLRQCEDAFEVVPMDASYRQKVYRYKGCEVYLRPAIYWNGWVCLSLVPICGDDDPFILTVNLERNEAMGIPNRIFIDINNETEALDFLVSNGLASITGYTRRSGLVAYPMVILNLPLIYEHDPDVFQYGNLVT